MSDTFCIMPWVHLHVSQNGNVLPCCQAPPHKVHRFGTVNEKSIAEIWEDGPIQEFRKKQLAGEKDHRCKQCYLKEEQGLNSLRMDSNDKFANQVDEVLSGNHNLKTPVYFDIRFSNACNLKCRICGPWASSSWFKDAVELGMRKPKEKALTLAIEDEDAFFSQMQPLFSRAKEFYFAGGEPLMMEQHYRVLEALIQSGNTDCRLSYNTNFSNFQFKNHNVVDYWRQFKSVSISASLDGEGKRGELLRKNLNWTKVLYNRQLLIEELNHIKFQITPTVCNLNVTHLIDFHKNWVEQGFISVEDFVPNVLFNPKQYKLTVLPMVTQLELKVKYQKHLEWMNVQSILDSKKYGIAYNQFKMITELLGSKDESALIEYLKESILKIDSLRNENTVEVFPELKDIVLPD